MTWWLWLLAGVCLGVVSGAFVQREAWIYFGYARRPNMREQRPSERRFEITYVGRAHDPDDWFAFVNAKTRVQLPPEHLARRMVGATHGYRHGGDA